MDIAVARPVVGPLRRILSILLPLALLFGCADFVPKFEAASHDRITAVSREILGIYQELLSTPPSARRAKAIELQPRYDQVATDLRLHRLIEESRSNNAAAVRITDILLETLQESRAAQLSGDPSALSNAALELERDQLERQLLAALKGEEAKKLADPNAGGGA